MTKNVLNPIVNTKNINLKFDILIISLNNSFQLSSILHETVHKQKSRILIKSYWESSLLH